MSDGAFAKSPTDALIMALSSLELGPMADRVAAHALMSLPASRVVTILQEITAHASRSSKADRALAALTRAIQLSTEVGLTRARICELHAAALELELHLATALLADTPRGPLPSDDFEPPFDPEIGQMSLGHKKMLARKADPDHMARLAAQGDVRVIRELLFNPRLTESLVVRIAARRPVRAEVLVEIFRSPRWGVRALVRKAIALNPCTPPDLAVRLLPHLSVAELRTLIEDGQLHTSVCEAAQCLAGQRHAKAEVMPMLQTSISSIDEGGEKLEDG